MHPNFHFLNKLGNISEETFLEIANITEFKRLKAGTQLIKHGEVPTKLYFLVGGVVRCYVTTEKGKEFNKSFYLQNHFVASLTALVTNKPSKFVFETLTDCKIYEVDYHKIKDMCKTNLALSNLNATILEYVYINYEKRLLNLITLDATERYLALRKEIPDLETIIPQYHIASYLGITPVQLSRIRKKIEVR